MPSRIGSRLVAAAFAVAATFHLVAIALPRVDPTPAWRHALFVAINAGYGVAFLARPRWLLVALAPLVAQQLASHGSAFVRAWEAGRFDGQSAAVLAALPLIVGVAYGCWRDPVP